MYSLVCSILELTFPGAATGGKEGRGWVKESYPSGVGRSGLHPAWTALNFITLDLYSWFSTPHSSSFSEKPFSWDTKDGPAWSCSMVITSTGQRAGLRGHLIKAQLLLRRFVLRTPSLSLDPAEHEIWYLWAYWLAL